MTAEVLRRDVAGQRSAECSIDPVPQCVGLRVPRHADLVPAAVDDVAEIAGGREIGAVVGVEDARVIVIRIAEIDVLPRVELDRQTVMQADGSEVAARTTDRIETIGIVVKDERHAVAWLLRTEVDVERHVEVMGQVDLVVEGGHPRLALGIGRERKDVVGVLVARRSDDSRLLANRGDIENAAVMRVRSAGRRAGF